MKPFFYFLTQLDIFNLMPSDLLGWIANDFLMNHSQKCAVQILVNNKMTVTIFELMRYRKCETSLGKKKIIVF